MREMWPLILLTLPKKDNNHLNYMKKYELLNIITVKVVTKSLLRRA